MINSGRPIRPDPQSVIFICQDLNASSVHFRLQIVRSIAPAFKTDRSANTAS